MATAEEPGPSPLGIAPLEADLEAMRETLRQLEAALDAREPARVEELLSPELGDEEREGVLEAARARIRSLPQGATYAVRSDIGPGAVVPVGPERVQVQVTGTIRDERGGSESGAVYLELSADESGGRRRWLIRTLRFSGVRSGPTPAGAAGLAAAGVLAGVLLVAAFLILLRRRRKRARR
jgi:hypothetical protein